MTNIIHHHHPAFIPKAIDIQKMMLAGLLTCSFLEPTFPFQYETVACEMFKKMTWSLQQRVLFRIYT